MGQYEDQIKANTKAINEIISKAKTPEELLTALTPLNQDALFSIYDPTLDTMYKLKVSTLIAILGGGGDGGTVPVGGLTGQGLGKQTNTDNDLIWMDFLHDLVAGTGVTIDKTNPFIPIISAIPQTTAGTYRYLYFTGETTTTTEGTFYDALGADKGDVAVVTQNVLNLQDGVTQWFGRDLLGIIIDEESTVAAGDYNGEVSILATQDKCRFNISVEVYIADAEGVVIDSGIDGMDVGNLGVRPIAVLTTGEFDLKKDDETQKTIFGSVIDTYIQPANTRARYHVGITRVNDEGNDPDVDLYYGYNHAGFVSIPFPLNTDGILNVSDVAGHTTSDALNALLAAIPVTSNFVPYVGANADVALGVYNLTAENITTNKKVFIGQIDDNTTATYALVPGATLGEVQKRLLGTAAFEEVTNLVPYTGADKDVDLGDNNFIIDGIVLKVTFVSDHILIENKAVGGAVLEILYPHNTVNEQIYFPINKSGTLALTSDIPAAPDLSLYVPYTGADKDVNLGENDLTLQGVIRAIETNGLGLVETNSASIPSIAQLYSNPSGSGLWITDENGTPVVNINSYDTGHYINKALSIGKNTAPTSVLDVNGDIKSQVTVEEIDAGDEKTVVTKEYLQDYAVKQKTITSDYTLTADDANTYFYCDPTQPIKITANALQLGANFFARFENLSEYEVSFEGAGLELVTSTNNPIKLVGNVINLDDIAEIRMVGSSYRLRLRGDLTPQQSILEFVERVYEDGGKIDSPNCLLKVDESASIELIPTAYKEGVVYSILSADGIGDFDFTRSTGAYRTNEQGVLEWMEPNVPRIDHSDLGCPKLLLEGESENLLTWSEDFSTVEWSKLQGGTGVLPIITTNYAVAPDGSSTANRCQFDVGGSNTVSDFSRLQQAALTTTNPNLSIYVKSNDSNTYPVNFSYSGDAVRVFDVYPNVWTRIKFNATTSGGFGFRLELRGSYTNIDTADILIWGAQLEQQSTATSYIPTTDVTATRAAETCVNSGNVDSFNSEEGVLFADIEGFPNSELAYRNISISDSDSSNYLNIGLLDDQINVFLTKPASAPSVNVSIPLDTTQRFRLAFKWKLNSFEVYINAEKKYESNSGYVFSADTLSRLRFDNGSDGLNNFCGKTSNLKVYKTADIDLEDLTAFDSYLVMAYALGYGEDNLYVSTLPTNNKTI